MKKILKLITIFFVTICSANRTDITNETTTILPFTTELPSTKTTTTTSLVTKVTTSSPTTLQTTSSTTTSETTTLPTTTSNLQNEFYDNNFFCGTGVELKVDLSNIECNLPCTSGLKKDCPPEFSCFNVPFYCRKETNENENNNYQVYSSANINKNENYFTKIFFSFLIFFVVT